MKYTVKLVNGEVLENVTRGFWEQLMEAWAWRTFKMPDGKLRYIPRASILYYEIHK